VTTLSGKKINFSLFSSKYHVELNPSELGIYDKTIMQETIKDLAQTPLVTFCPVRFKTIILLESEFLSKDAQNALRRTLEKFYANIRVILLTNSLERITCAMKSRFLKLKISDVMNNIDDMEIEPSLNMNVKNVSKEICSNLKMAFLKRELDSMKANRQVLYRILDRCISPSALVYAIVEEMFEDPTIPKELHSTILELASKYENRICLGPKMIYHMEAFLSSIYLLFSNHQ